MSIALGRFQGRIMKSLDAVDVLPSSDLEGLADVVRKLYNQLGIMITDANERNEMDEIKEYTKIRSHMEEDLGKEFFNV
jgi:hypothetical protein